RDSNEPGRPPRLIISASAMVLDVVAQVFLVRVILFLLHRPRPAAGDRRGALARLGGTDIGGEREEPLRIGRIAPRAGRNFIRLHHLFEAVAALAAFVVIDRHATKIPSDGDARHGDQMRTRDNSRSSSSMRSISSIASAVPAALIPRSRRSRAAIRTRRSAAPRKRGSAA